MPRKLPDCAYCGKPPKDFDCVKWMSPKLPGKPEVGWHCFDSGSCDELHPLRAVFPASDFKLRMQQRREITRPFEVRLAEVRALDV